MNDNIIKTRLKVLEKLFTSGYDTDKKIVDMKIEEIICNENFNRSDLTFSAKFITTTPFKITTLLLCLIKSQIC